MADVVHIDSTKNGGTGTAISVTKPTGIASGDVVIVIINNNANPTITDNNGATPFTKVYEKNEPNPDAGGGHTYQIWRRVAGGSEPASYAFTSTLAQRWSISALAYQNVHADIFEDTPSDTTRNTGNSTTPATNSLDISNAGAMILAVAFYDNETATFSAFPGDSFTNRESVTGNQLHAVSDKPIAAPATQSSVSWTCSFSGLWATNIFSLKPTASATAIQDTIDSGGVIPFER